MVREPSAIVYTIDSTSLLARIATTIQRSQNCLFGYIEIKCFLDIMLYLAKIHIWPPLNEAFNILIRFIDEQVAV
jgi:hypothetical protein